MDSAALAAAGAPFAPANALTSQREMFCRVYVACGNAAEAARQAGYAPDSARQQGHRLLADDTITHRIQELWAAAEVARTADRDLLIDKAERLFDAAMEAKNFNAAARALGLQARFAGFTGPARDREEVVPGRPGPVARAAARKAAAKEQEARQGGSEAVADGGSQRPDVSATDATRAPSSPGGEGPGVRACRNPDDIEPDAPAQRPAAPSSCQQPHADPLPAAGPDPWAEAARIERERRLAGLHGTLSALRRRERLASDAALAARLATEAA